MDCDDTIIRIENENLPLIRRETFVLKMRIKSWCIDVHEKLDEVIDRFRKKQEIWVYCVILKKKY